MKTVGAVKVAEPSPALTANVAPDATVKPPAAVVGLTISEPAATLVVAVAVSGPARSKDPAPVLLSVPVPAIVPVRVRTLEALETLIEPPPALVEGPH